MFRLTQDERLDGHTDCTLWAPFAKMHVIGQLFISNNYICFNSREEDVCQLIIPLREVNTPESREHLHQEHQQLMSICPQVSVVEKADSSSVLPCPVSISTKNKMNFLFANLKDRDFLVQRISDFLQRTPDSSDAALLSPFAHSVCFTPDSSPGVRSSVVCPEVCFGVCNVCFWSSGIHQPALMCWE